MNADGTGQHRIVSGGGDPSWSPDGKRIVYDRQITGYVNEIVVTSATGVGLTVLRKDAESPVWSPNGKRIAFSSDGHGSAGIGVGVMNPDGSGVKTLYFADVPYENVSTPAWSPSGRDIAYISDRGPAIGEDAPDEVRIYVIQPVPIDNPFYLLPRKVTDRPAWSADGKWITYGGENGQIYEIAGNKVVQLTHGGLWKSEPAWSPVLTSASGQVSGTARPTMLG
jgi:TolB protein